MGSGVWLDLPAGLADRLWQWVRAKLPSSPRQETSPPPTLSPSCVPAGECLITGQSHFKSFDDRYFTFSGVCQYLLAQDCQDHSFSIVIESVQVSCAGAVRWQTEACGVGRAGHLY